MQRKNNILKSSRNAMALIMAIAVVVIIGTVMALSMALTVQTGKRTTDLYLYEQSILLSKSATEYALLLIEQNPPCTNLDTSFVQDSIYNVDISISYIYDATDGALCATNGGTSYATVATQEQSGSALIDVAISVTDTNTTTEPIRYFRRTIQKL